MYSFSFRRSSIAAGHKSERAFQVDGKKDADGIFSYVASLRYKCTQQKGGTISYEAFNNRPDKII